MCIVLIVLFDLKNYPDELFNDFIEKPSMEVYHFDDGPW